jgi:hypothetical protein
MNYVAGDGEHGLLNHWCGEPVPVPRPVDPQPPYLLRGPGIGRAEALVPVGDDKREPFVHTATLPGHYQVLGADDQSLTCFSLNVAEEESRLERLSPAMIEALFGPESVLPAPAAGRLIAPLEARWYQPRELLPRWMGLLVLALIGETILANKWYSRRVREVPAVPETQRGQAA